MIITPTLATSAYSMRTIVDIREVTEIELTLPYMLDNPWQQFDLDMGQLDIFVLNTLQRPDTVGASIDCLVYYSAAPDFDLAAPNSVFNQAYCPQSGDRPYLTDFDDSDVQCNDHSTLEPQSDDKPNIKTKNELIGEVLGLLQSPAKRVLAGLLHHHEKQAEAAAQ